MQLRLSSNFKSSCLCQYGCKITEIYHHIEGRFQGLGCVLSFSLGNMFTFAACEGKVEEGVCMLSQSDVTDICMKLGKQTRNLGAREHKAGCRTSRSPNPSLQPCIQQDHSLWSSLHWVNHSKPDPSNSFQAPFLHSTTFLQTFPCSVSTSINLTLRPTLLSLGTLPFFFCPRQSALPLLSTHLSLSQDSLFAIL